MPWKDERRDEDEKTQEGDAGAVGCCEDLHWSSSSSISADEREEEAMN